MSNGNGATRTRYKVAKRDVEGAYRNVVRGEIDANKLTMYDIPDEGPGLSSNPAQQYPDYTEDQVFAITGPLGEASQRKGTMFRTLVEAVVFYSKLQGAPPVVTLNGKPAATSASQEEAERDLRNRWYGLKFRLPRSPVLIAHLKETRGAK